jgi:hypothetical protein
MAQPTPHPEVNAVTGELLRGVRGVLGPELVGAYLGGSLAAGGFDRASDVDVVLVTEREVTDPQLAALDAMHQRVAAIDAWCATQLECTYVSRAAIRRFDPACAVHANLDRGAGERLKRVAYDEGWIASSHLLRTRGITLAGPPPDTLIDPVPPDALRNAMRPVLAGWARGLIADPAPLRARGYQSYVVLSLCRIAYTSEHGDVVSKHRAAEWGMASLAPRWRPLIGQALRDRLQPHGPASAEAVAETVAFLRERCDAADG